MPISASRMAGISQDPVIRQFAQGAAQEATQPVAAFLAPPVDVSTSVGRYKKYTEKNRFHIPETRRGLGGYAAEIKFEATDETYNCTPHSLDFPVDNLEQLDVEGLENMFREGAVAVAEVAALAHEKAVIDAALTAVGAGTTKHWGTVSSPTDPVADIDAAILQVIKAAKYGSLMGIGVLFGATAFTYFKNNANVRGKFVVGTGGKGSVGLAIPTEDIMGQLFLGTPEVKTSYMVYDNAAEGVTEDIQFILDSSVLIFARKESPTRRDPSFMKTFRLMGQWMVPGAYMRQDQRVEVAKFDWSEDIKVTNSTACVRLNPTLS